LPVAQSLAQCYQYLNKGEARFNLAQVRAIYTLYEEWGPLGLANRRYPVAQESEGEL
jgi:hypothetical protein